MPTEGTILAVLQSGIALAGLLLIFSGYLFGRANSYAGRRGDIFKLYAKLTLIPIIMALALSWFSIDALEGAKWAAANLMLMMKVTLGATALVAFAGVLVGSP
jgi:hypothetical protein